MVISLLPGCESERAADLRLAGITVLGVIVLGSMGWFVTTDRSAWVVAAIGAHLAVIGYVLLRVDHTNGLGVANVVTLFRGLLIAAIAGFIVASPRWAWLPATMFAMAGLLDWIDGAIARRTRTSRLGARLDSFIDAMAILLGGGAAIAAAGLPSWYLVAGLLWFGYVGALALRKRQGKTIFALPESRLRRPIGVAQLLVIILGLTPVAPHAVLSFGAGVALIALLGSFSRDWAAASGRGPRSGTKQTVPLSSTD